MTTSEARRRNVRLTVFALLGVIMLIVGMFVRQFVSPDRLDPEWLRVHGAVLFDPAAAGDERRIWVGPVGSVDVDGFTRGGFGV